MSHCTQPTIYNFFCFEIEIKTKADSYMPCEAMAHSPKSYMYGSWEKRVYSTFFCIGCARANLKFEQIYSHCKWIVHETLKHMSAKHFSICTKYGTKEFTQKL